MSASCNEKWNYEAFANNWPAKGYPLTGEFPVSGRENTWRKLQGKEGFDFFESFSANAFDVEELVDGAELAAKLGSFVDDGFSGFRADIRELGELIGGSGVQVEHLGNLLTNTSLTGHNLGGVKHIGGESAVGGG